MSRDFCECLREPLDFKSHLMTSYSLSTQLKKGDIHIGYNRLVPALIEGLKDP